jgi:hypothetical protein
MKIALSGYVQSLAGMDLRAAIRKPAETIFHRLERHGHGQNILNVCFRQQ